MRNPLLFGSFSTSMLETGTKVDMAKFVAVFAVPFLPVFITHDSTTWNWCNKKVDTPVSEKDLYSSKSQCP